MQTRSKKRIGFICTHVAEQGAPVCLIEHSEPIDEIDSGWGIYCGAAEHSNDELRITDLERFTGLDSDLAGLFASTPQGSIAWRSSRNQAWVIEPAGADPLSG
jgi:hypothetical protein